MRQELVAGGAVVVLALIVIAITASYPVGTLSRMGPGMFPLVSGIILLLIGGGIILQGLSAEDEVVEQVSLRPIVAVFAGLILWTMLAPWIGLVPATIALVVATSLAQAEASLLGIAVTSILLSAFGAATFIYGLGIRLSVFGG